MPEEHKEAREGIMEKNEFRCPRCGQLIRIITVDKTGKEFPFLNPKIKRPIKHEDNSGL